MKFVLNTLFEIHNNKGSVFDFKLMLYFSEESVSRVEIDLVFRTFSDEGIILYADGGRTMASTSPTTPVPENDFISLAIIQGYVEFRYDLGSGVPLVLRSAEPVRLGHWHHVVAKRYHQVLLMYYSHQVL